jgi:hypothetical protein
MIGLDWTPAVLDNFVTFISSSIFGGVFQNEFTSSHALHWQDHSFYTEGARRQEMFVRDTALMRAGQRIVIYQGKDTFVESSVLTILYYTILHHTLHYIRSQKI